MLQLVGARPDMSGLVWTSMGTRRQGLGKLQKLVVATASSYFFLTGMLCVIRGLYCVDAAVRRICAKIPSSLARIRKNGRVWQSERALLIYLDK